MSNNKFEIRIIKDVGGKDISLDNMSIAAAKSLNVFIESLTKIAELQDNSKDFRVSLTRGSAQVALEAPVKKIETIKQQLNEVAENKSQNKVLVSSWRSIQQTISANGLEYDVIFAENGRKESVLKLFKETKNFQIKRKQRKKPEYSLKAYTGRLFDVGGKKHSNIHIELSEDKNLTIACSEIDVKDIIKYIYSDVTVLLWENNKAIAGTENYQLCDFYSSVEEGNEYEKIINKLMDCSEDERAKKIYSTIESLNMGNKIGEIKKYIKLFNHKSTDPTILRMILVATKSIKDEPPISSVRSEIKQKCVDALGEIF